MIEDELGFYFYYTTCIFVYISAVFIYMVMFESTMKQRNKTKTNIKMKK